MKFSLSKIALAAAALTASGYAYADVNLNSGAGVRNYAAELVSQNNPAPGGTSNTITDDEMDVDVDLGFGISNAQTRFLRFDFTNATFNAGVNAGSLTGLGGSSTVVAQGGGSSQSFVIFQVTTDADYGPGTPIDFNLGSSTTDGFDVLNDASPVLLKYRQFGTAGEAANATNAIVTTENTMATFSPALQFGVNSAGTNTASVAALSGPFTKFLSPPSVSTVLASVGTVNLGVSSSFAKDGTSVSLANLVDPGTKLVVTTNNNYNSLASMFLDFSAGGCDNTSVTATNPTATTRDIVTDQNTLVGAEICYTANGTTAIEIQDFNVSLTVVPDVNTDTASPGTNPLLGSFLHDGTTLKFPYAAGAGGTATFIQLANQGTANALAQILCYKTTGAPSSGVGGVTVNAGNTKSIGMAALGCAAGTTSVQVNLNVPVGTVIGSLVRSVNADGSLGLDGAVGNQ